MHDADKIGSSALGLLVRTKLKKLVNACPLAVAVYNCIHKMAASFSYAKRFESLRKVGEGIGYKVTKLELDLNNTCVAAKHNLFLSVIKNTPPLKSYFIANPQAQDSEKRADEWEGDATSKEEGKGVAKMLDTDWEHAREIEGILDISRYTTKLAQFEQHPNRGMGPVYRLKLLSAFRDPTIKLVDTSKLKNNTSPRPLRTPVKVEDLSELGKTVLNRAKLEAERRFCGNKTEEVTGNPVEVSNEDLLCMVLDPRCVPLLHSSKLLKDTDKKRAEKLLKEEYIAVGLEVWKGRESATVVVSDDAVDGKDAAKGQTGKKSSGTVTSGLSMVLMFEGEAMEFDLGPGEEEKEVECEDDETLERKRLEGEFEEAYVNWKGLIRKTKWIDYMLEQKKREIQEEQRAIDILEDLVDAQMMLLFKQIVTDEQIRHKKLYGLLPLLASCHLRALNSESFCKRVISCANNVVTKLHTRLAPDLIEKLVVLRMNKGFMEYMRQRYADELVLALGKGADKPGKGIVLTVDSD